MSAFTGSPPIFGPGDSEFQSTFRGMRPEQFKALLAGLATHARAAIRKELRAQGTRLADAQRARARVGTGATRRSVRVTEGREEAAFTVSHGRGTAAVGLARESVNAISVTFGQVGTGRFLNDLVVVVSAGGPETTTHTRAGSYDHANAQEYGTHKMRPRPFFWPVYRQMRPSIEGGLQQAVLGVFSRPQFFFEDRNRPALPIGSVFG